MNVRQAERSHVIRVLAVVATLACLLAPGRGAAQTSEPEGLVAGFARTWNAHDIESFIQLFTKDADFVNVVGDRLDMARLQTELEFVHTTFFKASSIAPTSVSTRMVRPDVAVVHFTWQLDGQVDAQGNPVDRRHGIVTFVAVKAEDGWRITALQNTNLSGPPAQ